MRLEGAPGPRWSIWVPGPPKRSSKKEPTRRFYREKIQAEARKVIAAPTASSHVSVHVWFTAPLDKRADVDNIGKPILDALKGVAYTDDRQVRAIMVTALERGGSWQMGGHPRVLARLLRDEFLINIYDDVYVHGRLEQMGDISSR